MNPISTLGYANADLADLVAVAKDGAVIIATPDDETTLHDCGLETIPQHKYRIS